MGVVLDNKKSSGKAYFHTTYRCIIIGKQRFDGRVRDGNEFEPLLINHQRVTDWSLGLDGLGP